MLANASPTRRAVALSTLQVVGDAKHLVSGLHALGSAYEMQTNFHARILARSYCRTLASVLMIGEQLAKVCKSCIAAHRV
jgi:hypothetical protein